jgi:hypothetical protein
MEPLDVKTEPYVFTFFFLADKQNDKILLKTYTHEVKGL